MATSVCGGTEPDGHPPAEPEPRPHKRKREAAVLTPECGCGGVEAELGQLRQHHQALNKRLEDRMHQYVQRQVEAAIGKVNFGFRVPTKRAIRLSARREKQGALPEGCFVCGRIGEVAVHRELGVRLCKSCRRQVKTFRESRVGVKERRELWKRAVVHLNKSQAAMIIAHQLGVQMVPEEAGQNIGPCPAHLAQRSCSVCMEQLGLGTRVMTLECSSQHVFHHECIRVWLLESRTCPLCREDISAQCVDAGEPRGRLQDVLNLKSGCSGDAKPDEQADPDSAELDEAFLDMLAEDGAVELLESWEQEPEVQQQLLETSAGGSPGGLNEGLFK